MTSKNRQVDNKEWLSLGQAAEWLNVHPTTLRRWADDGEVPVMLTPGGHRRFAAEELEQFSEQRYARRKVAHLEQIWADLAMTQVRREIRSGAAQTWMERADEANRARHRELGQRLMALTVDYLSDANESEDHLAEAHRVGEEYAAIFVDMGLSLSDALHASILFRDMLVETALDLPSNCQARPEASLQLLRRIDRLLNVVHLAIADTYDVAITNRLPRT